MYTQHIYLGRVLKKNIHFLILQGHGSHVTIQTLEQAIELGLDMLTLPLHMSHALHPLDITCFNHVKNVFKKKRNLITIRNNYLELDKATLVE
jgi:hypothetical protein